MWKPFDIFKIDSNGESVWVGEGEDLEEATDKAKAALAADPSCDFCVVNPTTGEIESVQLSEVGE